MATYEERLPKFLGKIQEEWARWQTEYTAINNVMAMYQGYSTTNKVPTNAMLFSILTPMAESAMASVVPPDLQVTVIKNKAGGLAYIPEDDEKWLATASKTDDWIGEFRRAVLHAHISGRLAFHVGTLNGKARIRVADPTEVFWPMNCPRSIELPWICSMRKVNAAILLKEYPRHRKDIEACIDDDNVVGIFEITDITEKVFSICLQNGDYSPLLVAKGDDFWNPWVIKSLTDNGQDMLGLSPFRLAYRLGKIINNLIDRMQQIAGMQVPSFLVDSAQIDEKTVAKIAELAPGQMLGAKFSYPVGSNPVPIFQSTPTPQISEQLFAIYNLLEAAMSYLTGISATARGQTVGARTATEMALIESQSRGLATMRQAALYDAFARATAKALVLHQYMQNREDIPLDVEEHIDEVTETLQVTASSGSELNRNVLAERFAGVVMPYIKGNPNFDQRKLDELFTQIMQMPEDVLLSEEQIQQIAAQAQAAQLPSPTEGAVDESTL